GIGGGLYIDGGRNGNGTCPNTPAKFTAQNSLIANNGRGNGITLDTPDDGFTDCTVEGMLAYNLIGTTQNFYISGPQGGNITGQDPLLGPFQNNGGSTQTHALLPGSPAIDAGAPAGCTAGTDANGNPIPLTNDQRGLARPETSNGRCDMGSFERQVS